MSQTSIRLAQITDLESIQQIFDETISHINSNDYNQEQIRVWKSRGLNPDAWLKRLNEQYFLVAELKNIIVGFASLESNYLDMIFVHKDFQRMGIASNLLNEIEAEWSRNGTADLFANVSLTALPFFQKRGFEIVRKQVNNLDSVELINYRMSRKRS